MKIELPAEVLTVLDSFDERADGFRSGEVERALAKSISDAGALSAEQKRGLWVERTSFGLRARDIPGGGPWGSYFQPWMTAVTKADGSVACVPDIGEFDDDVLLHWVDRARSAKHPVLAARYADLVWDLGNLVSTEDRGRERFECVGRAIDAYLAASRIDDGEAWGETRFNLGRALQLSMSIKDKSRTSNAVEAIIEYVERTAKDDKVGTFGYIFDYLLPGKKGPELTSEQEARIVQMFEKRFAAMTVPGSGWDAEPYGPRDVGLRLADYYARKGDQEAQKRVLGAIAGVFERRAKMGDPLAGLLFLQEARQHFIAAGLREEAERIQLEAQGMGPEAEKRLARTSVSHEISKEDVEQFVEGMVEGGLEAALTRFAVHFLPQQDEIKARAAEMAEQFPLQAIFSGQTAKLGHGHIEANVGDDAGDPDGRMAHETSQHLQFQAPWIGWVLERLVDDGMTAMQVVDFLGPCPLFEDSQLPIVRQGLEAHFLGDYVQAVHLLIPQIERALVRLPPLAGKPSNKAHRSGRGVMQFKNLNDVLAKDEWPIRDAGGENLRMYLVSALAHPKGLNIRNDVCHGLWSASHFTRQASERVLHVLLAVSLIRPEAKASGSESSKDSSEEPPRAVARRRDSRILEFLRRVLRLLLRFGKGS